jgi:hypothetical protein
LTLSIRGEKEPYYPKADYVPGTFGGSAITLCCNEIRKNNPSWTGDLFMGVGGFTGAIYDLTLWSK